MVAFFLYCYFLPQSAQRKHSVHRVGFPSKHSQINKRALKMRYSISFVTNEDDNEETSPVFSMPPWSTLFIFVKINIIVS